MSEFIKIASNGQWDLVKNDGTGVVRAPMDLSRVSDIGVAAAPKPTLPKITPQPADKVGLATRPSNTSVNNGNSTLIRPSSGDVDPTSVRPQTGTQLYAMSPQGSHSVQQPANTQVQNTNSDFLLRQQGNRGVTPHPDPFGAALAQQGQLVPAKNVPPTISPVVKEEGSETHDLKGRCNNCGSKACSGSECKVDHAKVAVEANDEKNKGFRNQIKVAKNGQWNLEHCSRCKEKPCTCITTPGILVDR